MNPRFFPTCLMVLNVCASLACAASGDFKRAAYWMAAFVLNFCITY